MFRSSSKKRSHVPRSISAACAVCLVLSTVFSVPAQAAFALKDAQVMARVLGFMDHPPGASVSLGLVYDPGVAGSRGQAEALSAQMGASYKAGNFTLVPKLVKAGDVGGAGLNAMMLMDGVGGASISAAIKGGKTPCFTSDRAQVKNGNCLIGINTDQKVEILLNRALATASGITFSAAFGMMIKEI